MIAAIWKKTWIYEVTTEILESSAIPKSTGVSEMTDRKLSRGFTTICIINVFSDCILLWYLSTYPMTFGTSVYRKKQTYQQGINFFPLKYLPVFKGHVILLKSFSKMNVHKPPRIQELNRHSLMANENDVLRILVYLCFGEMFPRN